MTSIHARKLENIDETRGGKKGMLVRGKGKKQKEISWSIRPFVGETFP